MIDDVSEDEGRSWVKELEVVEWVKNRTQKGLNVLYERSASAINMFAVLNIAS
jgi:hypothetical protein